jgi:membrane protease YdiL (CAAX protease family)
MIEGGREAIGAHLRASMETTPGRLTREAVSLGVILLATLTLAALERRGLIPGAGYASSLALLALSAWHQRQFRAGVPLLSPRGGRHALPWATAIIFAGTVLLVARASLPQSSPPVAPWDYWMAHTVSPAKLLHLLLLVPLSEELYFRGLLFDHLRRAFTPVRAVVLCSLLFAVLHASAAGALSAAALSLGACALVLATRSLACAVQLHVAWNAIAEINPIDSRGDWPRGTVLIFAFGVILAIALLPAKRTAEAA